MEPSFINNHTMIELENLLMKVIIESLIDLGGVAERKEIKRYIYDNSPVIPEDYIDFIRTSKRTGKQYKPFNFQFNFAIKHLSLAEFLKYPKSGTIELTEKGRKTDLNNFDSQKDVRSISQVIIDKESKDKNIKKIVEIDPLEEAPVDLIDEVWREQLIGALKKMSPTKFEMFARGLINKMGIELDKVLGIQSVADGGIDGFGYITADDFRTTRVALQAKRWEGKVSSPEIDKFRGAMDKYNAEFGIFMTTSNFTRAAIESSRTGTRVITLINGEDICDLVAKYEFYVVPVNTYELEEFYFIEE